MLDSLLADRRFPNSPDVVSILENFDAPVNIHSNYGQRLTAYLQVVYITNFTHIITFNDLLHTVNPQRKPKGSINSILVTSNGKHGALPTRILNQSYFKQKLNFGWHHHLTVSSVLSRDIDMNKYLAYFQMDISNYFFSVNLIYLWLCNKNTCQIFRSDAFF